MQFKLFFLLAFTLTAMLHAQADSSATSDSTEISNDQAVQKKHKNRSQEIIDFIFGSTDPDSMKATYAKRSESKIVQPDSETGVGSKSNKFGIGYEYSMLLNTKSQEQGISIHKIFYDYGIEAFIHYNKADEQDISKLFPSENVSLISHNMYESEGTLDSEPFVDYESRFGLKILKVLHQGSQGLIFGSVGFGLKHTTSMIYSRKYSKTSTGSGYFIRYLEESSEKDFSTKAFVSVSLGADYNITENLLAKGEIYLFGGNKGQFGPSVGLYYWIK